MSDFDLIVGIHSIKEAIANSARAEFKLYCTDDGKDELLKRAGLSSQDLEKVQVTLVSSHKLQEQAKVYFKELGVDFQRVPSGAFLLCSKLIPYDLPWLYKEVEKSESFKILCLDQVSDVHNGAAILRTASFYGADAVILPGKKSFGFTPSFFRIASGATEFIPLVQVSSLPKVVNKLNELGVETIALSEHMDEGLEPRNFSKLCLILGKEDTGISHAVMRMAKHKLSLRPLGKTLSLNVSIAGAVAMEKCFSSPS